MDHENGSLPIFGLVQHVGVKVVYPSVADGGVRHLDGKAASIYYFKCKIEFF